MASKKIKGITIEIDGDTTKLGKALEGAESSSKSLQSELKGINSLLKLDPSNVELLTQKQKVLTDAISSTEDKLKTLKTAQAQVQAQFDKGEITAEQYRDFQREIVATEKKLDGLKDEAKDFGSVFQQQVKVASESVQELGSKVEGAGKALSGVSAVAGAGLVASAKSAADNETAINKYIASTGKAVTETEKYKKLMETIYRNNYGESIEDVADKMRIVSNILGDLPDDELQSVVEKSYMLEDAYDMDFQENIRGVNALMDQFGITSEQAYELINQGAQKGLNQNQDLTDQIAEYSTYYAKLGFDAEDFFNIMISGAESGAYQIDYLNDAMKEFGIRTKDNSSSTNEAYETLGLNVDKINNKFAQGGTKAQEAFAEVTQAIMSIEDPVKRNEIGVALFGTKFEDLEESAVFAMTTAKDQVNMLGDTVEQTSNTMYGGTSAKAQEALRSIQTAFAQLGEALLPIIAPIAEKIAELATKFSELSPVVQKIILVITGIVAALGPVLIIIGKVISAVGTIMPVITKIGSLLAKAGPILTTIKGAIMGVVGALGWPVIAITAIIGVIVLLWNKCEWFRNGVKAIWEKIKTGLQIAYEWLKGVIEDIGQFFVDLWNKIKEVWANIKAGFQSAYEWFGKLLNDIGQFFVDLWNNITTIFNNIVTWLDTYLVQPISNAFQAIKNFINLYIIQPLTSLWDNYIFPIVSKIIEIIAKIGEIIVAVFVGVATWINQNVIQPIVEFVVNLYNQIKTIITDIWNKIVEVFSAIPSWINENITTPIVNAVNAFKNTVVSIAKAIWDKIVEIFSVVRTWIYENITTPIINAVNTLKNTIANIAKAIWNKIVEIFSKVATWVKENVISPVVNSITSFKNKAIDIVTSIWNKITSTFGKVGSWFKGKFQEAYNGVTSAFSKIVSFFSGIWSRISSTFSGLGTKIGDAIGGAVKSGINGVISFIENTINKAIGLINGAIGLINKLPGVSVGKLSKLSLPRLATGTNYVPHDEMPAILHEGEQVVPKKYNPEVNDKHLKNAVFDALTSFTNTKMQNSNNQNGISELTRLMKQYMPIIVENLGQDIVLDDRTLVGKIAPKIDKQLGVIAINKSRGY